MPTTHRSICGRRSTHRNCRSDCCRRGSKNSCGPTQRLSALTAPGWRARRSPPWPRRFPTASNCRSKREGRKWLIAARIWLALVGDPSTKKTPIIDAALTALRAKDVDRRRQYAALKAFWDAQSKKEKAEALAARRGPPDHNRLIISDTTSEAAGEILMTSPNGVLGVYDELSGWFGQMERYGQSGQGLSERGFWLQARNGGPHSIDRIIRGSNYIPNLSITLVGGIQPEPMRKVAGNSSDDGLIQRLTPIMLRPAEMTDDEVDTEEADKDFADLIETLLDLTPTVGSSSMPARRQFAANWRSSITSAPGAGSRSTKKYRAHSASRTDISPSFA